jgi:hypothetical protein
VRWIATNSYHPSVVCSSHTWNSSFFRIFGFAETACQLFDVYLCTALFSNFF